MHARRVSGFTLVEVLVAVLVLGLGVVGAAATQLGALRTRHDARLSSDAVQIASGLADRMRANAAQMALPDGANPYLALDFDAAADALPAPPPCYGAAGNCDGAQMAGFDLFETMQLVHAMLPAGRIVVCRDAQPWDAGRRALTWDCGGGAGAPVVVKVGWGGATQDDPAADAEPRVALLVAGGGK